VFGTRRFLTALRSALGTRPADGATASPPARSAPRAALRSGSRPGVEPGRTGPTAGQTGPDATLELDPGAVRRPTWGYAPKNDGDLDPGEVVWTWVPYEERDGRGKDRPVLVVAVLTDGAVLAVQLTSTDHTGHADHVPLGVGSWDRDGRSSWAAIDRVFRVRQGGVRREGTFVGEAVYRSVEAALRRRYGWR
jgi:hypothetical protein